MGGRGVSAASGRRSSSQIVFAPIQASSERQRQYAEYVRAQMVSDLMRGGGYVSKDRNEDDFGPNSRKEVAAYIAAQSDARKILDHKSGSFRDEIFEVEYAKVPGPKDKSKSLIVGVKLPPSQSKALRKDYKTIEDGRRRSGKAQRDYDRLMSEAGIDNPTKAMSRKITLGTNGSPGKSELRYPELNRKYKEAMTRFEQMGYTKRDLDLMRKIPREMRGKYTGDA